MLPLAKNTTEPTEHVYCVYVQIKNCTTTLHHSNEKHLHVIYNNTNKIKHVTL